MKANYLVILEGFTHFWCTKYPWGPYIFFNGLRTDPSTHVQSNNRRAIVGGQAWRCDKCQQGTIVPLVTEKSPIHSPAKVYKKKFTICWFIFHLCVPSGGAFQCTIHKLINMNSSYHLLTTSYVAGTEAHSVTSSLLITICSVRWFGRDPQDTNTGVLKKYFWMNERTEKEEDQKDGGEWIW